MSEAKQMETHLLSRISRQAVLDLTKQDYERCLQNYDSYTKARRENYKLDLQIINEYPSREKPFEDRINFLASKKKEVKSVWLKEKIQDRIDNQERNLSFLKESLEKAKKNVSEYKEITFEEYEKLINPTLNERLIYAEKYFSSENWKIEKEKSTKEFSEVQAAIEELKFLVE